MADFLEQLVQDAERTVSSGYYDVQLASAMGPRLSSVLQRGSNFPIIAEVKIASPSRGRLSSHAPDELIGSYVSGGAAALSVLTEPVRFLGSLETLRAAAGSGLPVLMKDFIVSEVQMDAAAAGGAGTVLLIQEVFDIVPRARRDELISYAHRLGLEVLLEAASNSSLIDAMRSDADVLGINQRDLRTFVVDRSKGAHLLPLALTASRPVVVMSGLECRKAIEEVRDHGASGALVGGRLSSSDDPGAALRELEVSR
jgi:indole-3-glycerol phosphate synthase